MADEEKAGGFGSIPGDLFEGLIVYFGTTPPMSAALEPSRIPILMQLARTEHAAANAEKDPYGVDVVFKCISIQSDFLTAQNATLPDPVRALAMNNILGTLQALKLLWVP
jgi:hypothetical protein